MTIDVIILAAGKGSRMKSDLPKVLHKLAGKSMLSHVLTAAEAVSGNITCVLGHGAEKVKPAFKENHLNFVEQTEQLGTGHAVLTALPVLNDSEKTLILYGDVPLIKPETLKTLIASQADVAVLTALVEDPTGYGRIIRTNEKVTGIVEQKDATEEQKSIKEINSGILAVNTNLLKSLIPNINNNNAQKEYYLTDLIELANNENATIEGVIVSDNSEILGANDRKQLAELEGLFRKRKVTELLEAGATLIDPSRIDIQGDIAVGKDVLIEPNVIFKGNVTLSDNVTIESNSVIINSVFHKGSVIYSHSRIEDSVVGEGSLVGPYARLRPGTKLAKNTKIGNFVETKKATIGEGSKVNHLSYVGDTTIGEKANLGAGTITCNYDGVNKHQTKIEDGAFIGSNTALVAPVSVGKNALVGAGSTITKDVPENSLAIARQKQKNLNRNV